MSVATTRNIIELQKAGNRALATALGHDDAQAFLRLCRGDGDFTKERHEWNPTNEEFVAEMARLQQDGYAEKLAARGVRIVTASA